MNVYRKRRITAISILLIMWGSVVTIKDLHKEPDELTQTSDESLQQLITSPTTPYTPGAKIQYGEVSRPIERTIDGLPICPECGQIIQHPTVQLTHAEKVMLFQAVEVETPGCSVDCKKGVASVILNRMYVENLPLTDVLYAENQFDLGDLSEVLPCADTVDAVNEVIEYGVIFPKYVTFFQGGEYHDWSDLKPFIKFDDTYFSYSEAIRDEVESRMMN